MNKFSYFTLKLPIVICLFLMTSSFLVPAHKFYLSLTEIRVDTKKQTLDVSCKIFTDDFEDLLLKKYGKKTDLSASTKNKEVQDLIIRYITENFKISVGGKSQKLNYVGYETDTDATWIYLETVSFKEKGKVNVTNTLLYDYLPEQTNLINFYWDDAEKSARLVNPEKDAEFSF